MGCIERAGHTDVRVELACGGLHAEAVLPAYIADAERLAPFFHEIDRDWRGWHGAKTAGKPDEDWLAVAAVHDGQGHVALTVWLSAGEPLSAEWSVSASLSIDIGSAAEIAHSLDRWTASVWPPEHRWRAPA